MENVVQPIRQEEIQFYGDMIIAVLSEDETVYVPMRPIVEAMGLDWAAQFRRIKNDEVLEESLTPCVVVTATQGQPDQRREMVCLPLKMLPGFLFGISAKRVKPEVREQVLRYRRECYDVLDGAFNQNDVTVRQDDELMQSNEPSAVAFRNALMMARMARQQYYLEKQVAQNTGQLAEMGQRLALIEANLNNPKTFVTQEQAQLISEGVKMIAGVLSKRSGKNEYGGTYVELYRRFGVTSYKHIPAGRFDETMNWLRNWYADLTDESDVPF